jgi:hypothetical protein
MRKMLDLDPWPEGETPPAGPSAAHILARIRRVWRDRRGGVTKST